MLEAFLGVQKEQKREKDKILILLDGLKNMFLFYLCKRYFFIIMERVTKEFLWAIKQFMSN